MTTIAGEPAGIWGVALGGGVVVVVAAAILVRAIRAERRARAAATARPAADAATGMVLVLGPAALRDVDALAAALPWPRGETPTREVAVRRALALAR